MVKSQKNCNILKQIDQQRETIAWLQRWNVGSRELPTETGARAASRQRGPTVHLLQEHTRLRWTLRQKTFAHLAWSSAEKDHDSRSIHHWCCLFQSRWNSFHHVEPQPTQRLRWSSHEAVYEGEMEKEQVLRQEVSEMQISLSQDVPRHRQLHLHGEPIDFKPILFLHFS